MAEETVVKFTFIQAGLEGIRKQIDSTKDALKTLGYDAKEVDKAFEGLKGAANGTKSSLQDINRAAKGAGDGANDLAQKQENIITQRYALYDVATTYGAISAAITAAGVAAGVAFASQESAFTSVERIARGSSDQISGLRDELTQLSTQMPVSFVDLSAIASLGAALDIPAESLAKFSETVAMFSATTGVTAETTATNFGKIASYMKLTQDEFDNLGSAILKAGNISVATEEQVLKFAGALALPASKAGIATDQVIALAGTLASFGNINVEGAGSAVSRVFEGINLAVAEGGDALNKYAATAGMTASQFALAWETDAGAAFNTMLAGLSTVDNLDVALKNLGITEQREARIISALATQYQTYMSIQGNVSSAWRDGIYMSESYGMVLDDLGSQFTILINALTNAAAAVGANMAPALGALIKIATEVLVVFTNLVNNPIGRWLLGTATAIGAVVAAFAFYRTIAALSTASTYALVTAQSALAGTGLRSGIFGLIGALFGYKASTDAASASTQKLNTSINALNTAASINLTNSVKGLATSTKVYSSALPPATAGTWGLTTALRALGAATIIGAILQAIVSVIFDMGGTAVSTGNAMNFLADAFYGIGNAAYAIVAGISPVLSILTGIFSLTTGKAPGEMLRDAAKATIGWGQSIQGSNIPEFNSDVADLGQYLYGVEDGGNSASDGVDNLADSANNASQEIRTLLDYSSDLSDVWKRAFDIRFSGEQSLDEITKKFNDIAQANEDARSAIEDLRDELNSLQADAQSLSADKSLKQYWLEVAEAYGDTLRAGELRADLAKIDADIATNAKKAADANKKLAKENDKLSRSTEGTSESALSNRDDLRSLVTAYQDHVEALAASGLSQDELAIKTEELRQDFITQATQLGYSKDAVDKYSRSFDDMSLAIARVPRNITVKADTNPAIQALNELEARMRKIGQTTYKGANVGPTSYNAAGDTRYAKLQDLMAQLQQLQAQLNATPLYRFLDRVRIASSIKNLSLAIQSGSYATGGYTGAGGKYEPAGIVHKGEYVVPKQYVNQSTGKPDMAYLNRIANAKAAPRTASYANGGRVTGSGAIELGPATIHALSSALKVRVDVDGQAVAQAVSTQNQMANWAGVN